MSARLVDTKWEQAVCDGCGYVEDSYADGEFSAVEGSELGHQLGGDWLWTYGDPIDLCPNCSIECPACCGEGCEQCGYHGRKVAVGLQSRDDTQPATSSPTCDGNRLTTAGDIRLGTKPIVDTTHASTIDLSELAGAAQPRLNLLIADARTRTGIPGLLVTVEATMTPEQAIEVRNRIDTWLARHTSLAGEQGIEVVDLDHAPQAGKSQTTPAPRRRPRRQCQFCFVNRSAILQWESRGCEERALQALRLAHLQEYDELLQREREAADAVTEQAWQLHLANKCSRAWRIAGTATNHGHVR